MNIEELLTKYTDLTHKRNKAYEEQKNLEILMAEVLYKNEEPYKLNDADGNYTGITLETPDDLLCITPGTVLTVVGAEWMLTDNWVSCFGAEFTNVQMFINIMRHRDNVRLIHKAY